MLKKAAGTPFYYLGPDLEEGPLPALFYFALSYEESLLVDPYNQPAIHLTKSPVRVFSLDLPFHGEGLPSVDAMRHWPSSEKTLKDFLEETAQAICFLLQTHCIETAGVFGLSRGGFIASHIAARVPEIKTLLAFAPLTHIEGYQELQLSHLKTQLYTKNIRIHIGGKDIRVGTDLCYAWVRELIETAYEHRIRSPQIELYIKPSIGHQGHGTSPETFQEGATWLLKHVL